MAAKWKRVLVLPVVLTCLSVTPGVSRANDVSLYQDVRIKNWAGFFHQRQYQSVIDDAGRDVLSVNPHPSAAYAWSSAHYARGTLNDAIAGLQDGPLKTALGYMPRVFQLAEQQKYQAITDLIPQAQDDQLTDIWVMRKLCFAAGQRWDLARMKRVSLRLIKARPDNFNGVWCAVAKAGTRSVGEWVRGIAAKNIVPADSAAGAFLAVLAASPVLGNITKLQAVDAFLAKAPGDPRAIRYRGHVLADLYRYQEALDQYDRAHDLFPLWIGNWSSRAKMLARLERFDQARQVVTNSVPVNRVPTPRKSAEIDAGYAQALLDAGERGRARTIAENALKTHPDHGLLNRQMAVLTNGETRLQHWQKALTATPDDAFAIYQVALQLRVHDRQQEGLDLIHAARDRGVPFSSSLFNEWSNTLNALGRKTEAVAALRAGNQMLPGSSWLHRVRADILEGHGNLAESAAADAASYELHHPLDYQLKRLVRRFDGNPDALVAEQERLRKAFPDVRSVWLLDPVRGTKNLTGNDLARQYALIDRAIAANPGRAWPYDLGTDIAYNARDHAREWQFAESALAATMQSPAEDRAAAIEDYAVTMSWARTMPRQQRLVAVNKALKQLETLDDMTGNRHDILQQRYRLYAALGDGKAAADAAIAFYRLDPDAQRNAKFLFTSLVGKHLENREQFVALHRWYSRDPYDGRRLSDIAHFHDKWGGSSLVALYYYDLMKSRAPDRYARETGRVDSALASLGAYQDHYLRRYHETDNISPSLRYVGWFRTSRSNAQNKPAHIEKLDLANQRAVLLRDGRQIEVQDDLVSGRPLLTRTGAAWVRMTYHPSRHSLTSIRDSAGNEITLTYNDGGQIVRIGGNTGKTLLMEYNDIGKPSRITVDGVGSIDVQYDSAGKILNVSSSAGHKTSLIVTRTFQGLLRMVRQTNRRSDLSRIPELPWKDVVLAGLRDTLRNAINTKDSSQDGRSAIVRARLQIGRHYLANLQARQSYARDAERELRSMFDQFTRYSPDTGAAIQTLEMLHDLTVQTFPHGVDPSRFRYWAMAGGWLATASAATDKDAAALEQLRGKMRAKPVQLAASERWLPKSRLNNRGYWRQHGLDDLVPATLRSGLVLRSVLMRRNGDFVVGTSAGVSVFSNGFWTWMGVDPRTGGLDANADPRAQKAVADIHAMAETDDGTLWLGTSGGVVRIAGDYQSGQVKLWRGPSDGLPSPNVSHLAATNNGVVAVTSKGLAAIRHDELLNEPLLAELAAKAQRVTALHAFSMRQKSGADAAVLLIAGEGGVFALTNGRIRRIYSQKTDDVVRDPVTGDLLMLRNGVMYRLAGWGDHDGLVDARPVPGQQDIQFANALSGLQVVPLAEGSWATGVLTDQGISILHRDHFEHLKLPSSDRVPAVLAASTRGIGGIFLTSEGVWELEGGRIHRDTAGRVRAIVTDRNNDLTYIARDRGVYLSESGENSPSLVRFSSIRANSLALDEAGRLYANDGHDILRFDPGNPSPKTLFSARPTVPGKHQPGPVSQIMIASDGTVWVTSGSSLFRWREGATQGADGGDAHAKEEFSIFVDPARFPARSDQLYTVQETVDGRIWVAASNEGHRVWRGSSLVGGLLEWTGDGFRRAENIYGSAYWFMSSYTPVDERTAIVGSVSGFSTHKAGHGLSSFYQRNDAGYLALRKNKTKMLFLGTRGVDIGQKTFLFGVAGGVVGWRDGQWFYPDRLNWLLPDDHLASYGSRLVNAVSADGQGRVFVGTDRGLLIYDPGGKSAADFLFSSNLGQMAFQQRDQQRMGDVSDVMLKRFGKDSAEGKLVRKLTTARDRVEALRTEIAQADSPLAKPLEMIVEQDRATPDVDDEENRADLAKLRKKLKKREKAHLRLLANIEKNHRSLYQMLELKPLDLVGLRRKLPADDVVVQYLPTEKRLFIHVVTRDQGTRIRQVKVSAEELFRRAARVAENMPGRTRVADKTGKGLADLAKVADAASAAVPLEEDLAWLYEHLLRPVEIDLADRRNVYIVPVSSLSYIPFSALIRQKAVTEGGQPEYAVQKFRLGYLPTLYILDLVLGHEPSIAESALIFGNPDGTLPGAEVEAAAIGDIMEDEAEVMIGEDASFDVLADQGPDSRVIHLATHAVLDGRRPERSHLVLSGGTRLSVLDAALLDLSATDLVVLSACESGVGAEGMEYATLARAFAHAGANTILATLWKIDDKVTVEMMKHFYAGLGDDKGVYAALADAQRAMIGKVPVRDWAAFIPMGRP